MHYEYAHCIAYAGKMVMSKIFSVLNILISQLITETDLYLLILSKFNLLKLNKKASDHPTFVLSNWELSKDVKTTVLFYYFFFF